MSRNEKIETPAGPAILKRTQRKTLAISVRPDGGLELAAPVHAPIKEIEVRVTKRLGWIAIQRRRFEEMRAVRPEPRYCSGASHRYLGRQYRLKVHRGPSEGVKLSGGYFQITTAKPTAENVKELLRRWLRQRAEKHFHARMEPWKAWCARNSLPEPEVRLRSMPKRWGSAHPHGVIYLNPDLIHAPSVCIDYVIAHEICHLKQPDHGPDFFRLLGRLFPGWKRVKERLEAAGTHA